MIIIPYIVVFSLISGIIARDDSFTEELFIKPLNADNVYNHFQFTTKWTVPETGFCESYSKCVLCQPKHFLLQLPIQTFFPGY